MNSSSPPPQSAHLTQVEKGCSQQQSFPHTSPISLKCLCDRQHYCPRHGSQLAFLSSAPPLQTIYNKILPFFHHLNRSPACLLSHHRVSTVCNRTSTNHFLFRNNHRILKYQSQKGPCRVSVVYLQPLPQREGPEKRWEWSEAIFFLKWVYFLTKYISISKYTLLWNQWRSRWRTKMPFPSHITEMNFRTWT